jgi:hypothetical protein
MIVALASFVGNGWVLVARQVKREIIIKGIS